MQNKRRDQIGTKKNGSQFLASHCFYCIFCKYRINASRTESYKFPFDINALHCTPIKRDFFEKLRVPNLQNEVRCRQIVQPHELNTHLSATIIIRIDEDHRVVIRSANLVELLVVDIALL